MFDSHLQAHEESKFPLCKFSQSINSKMTHMLDTRDDKLILDSFLPLKLGFVLIG